MEMSEEVRRQLMEMAGIQDVEEFEKMVRQVAPKSQVQTQSVGGETSPFQVHFVKLISMVENAGINTFINLNRNLTDELSHIFKIVNNEYWDIRTAIISEDETEHERIDGIETSKTFRDRGNRVYAKKDLEGALGFYCAAITSAPVEKDGTSREISLSLGNRSIVFMEMKRYDQCLDDLEAAFMFGYPSDLSYKLYDRKAKCYFERAGHPTENACEALRMAIEAAKHSSLNEKKKEDFISGLSNLLAEWVPKLKGNRKKQNEDDERNTCPYRIWERHPTFPPLSDSLDITYSDQAGRHIIAKKSIKAGEAIVIEEPIAAHLSRSFGQTNCNHCLKKCGRTILPSPFAPKKFKFCSLQCLKIAMATYHKVESKINISELFYAKDESETQQQMSGCISLAYRAITQRSVEFFKKNQEKFFSDHDIKFGIRPSPNYSYTNDEHYRGLYNLVNHNELQGDLDRIKFLIRTVVLLKCLQGSGYFGEELASKSFDKTFVQSYDLTPDELYIGRLLFHFQTGIQYNLHAVYQVDEKRMEAGKRIPLTDIGAGVYPTTIFFNHSCAPNTVRINMGKMVVYVAKRNISAGEQVTDCYGIHHLSIELKERQSLLTKGYLFQCTCEACSKDFPILAKLQAVVKPEVGLKLGNTFTRYKNLFGEAKYTKALGVCQEYLCKLEELKVPFPHRNYELAAIALCSCLWAIAAAAQTHDK